MRRALVLTVIVAAGSASPCDAQWSVSVHAGAIHTQSADLRIDAPSLGTALTFADVPFRSESFTPPIYYGYRFGHSVPRALAVRRR